MPKTRSTSQTASLPASTSVNAPPNRRADIVFVSIVTLIYLFCAGVLNYLVPFPSPVSPTGQTITNPDESAHVANALVYKSGHLPVFRAGDSNFEAHQPPLYYVLVAPFFEADKPGENVQNARLVSIFLGALMIWAAFACMRTVFPENPALVRGVPAFVGLLPMNISLCASISNDVLTNLMCIVALWQLARLVVHASKGSDPKALLFDSTLLGICIGAGLLTKTSCLVLIPTVLVAAWQLVDKKILDRTAALKMAAVSIGLSVVIVTPWWIRNTQLYGDPLAQHIFLSAFGNTAMTKDLLQIWSPFQYLAIFATWSFESFWGVFNSMKLFLPWPAYAVVAIFSVLELFMLSTRRRREIAALVPSQQIMLVCFASLIVFTSLAFLRFNTTFFQAQGRYLYPALVPIAAFTGVGIGNGKLTKIGRLGEFALGTLLLLDLLSLFEMGHYASSLGVRL